MTFKAMKSQYRPVTICTTFLQIQKRRKSIQMRKLSSRFKEKVKKATIDEYVQITRLTP